MIKDTSGLIRKKGIAGSYTYLYRSISRIIIRERPSEMKQGVMYYG